VSAEIITDPVQALFKVGKENSELHEELARVYSELTWYVRGLTYLAEMPNEAGPVAQKVLRFQPFKS
jgi:hypothetical protein